MIICRKCQRHHPDDIGHGPCECGADLSRDGIAVGSSPMAGSSVFDDPEADPFTGEAVSAPPAPEEPTPPPPAEPRSDPPPAALHTDGPAVAPEPPAPPSPPPPPVAPPGPPPPTTAKRRAGSFTPADVASVEPDPPPGPPVDATTEPVAAVVEASEAAISEPSRRARGVTPGEVLAAHDEPDAANVGHAPPDDQTVAGGPAPVDAVTEPIPTTTREPKEGEIACPACREPNLDLRRFCFNCGTKLPTPEFDDEDELTPEMLATRKRSWWGRLTGSDQAKRTARTFRGRARMAGGGKFRYASGLSNRFKLTAIVSVLMAGGGIVALIGPYRTMLDPILNRGTPGTSPASAELIDADEIEGYPAASAIDDKTDTGVAFVFGTPEELAELDIGAEADPTDEPTDDPDGGDDTPDGDAEEAGEAAPPAIGEPPTPGTLVIRLDEPMNVSKLYLALGLPDAEEDGPLLRRPSRVRVCAFANTCSELELADSTSLKEYGVDFGDDVESIRVTLLDVHESATVTYPLAVISEVRVGS